MTVGKNKKPSDISSRIACARKPRGSPIIGCDLAYKARRGRVRARVAPPEPIVAELRKNEKLAIAT